MPAVGHRWHNLEFITARPCTSRTDALWSLPWHWRLPPLPSRPCHPHLEGQPQPCTKTCLCLLSPATPCYPCPPARLHSSPSGMAQPLTLRQHLPSPDCLPPPLLSLSQCPSAAPNPGTQRGLDPGTCARHPHPPAAPALPLTAFLTCSCRLRRGPRTCIRACLSPLLSGTSSLTVPAPLRNLQRSPPAGAGCGAALGPAPPPAAPLSSIAATSADRGTLLALPSLPCSLWMVRARASRNSRSGARAACAGAGGGGGEVWNTKVWSDQVAGVHSWWCRAQGASCWLGPTMHMFHNALV